MGATLDAPLCGAVLAPLLRGAGGGCGLRPGQVRGRCSAAPVRDQVPRFTPAALTAGMAPARLFPKCSSPETSTGMASTKT